MPTLTKHSIVSILADPPEFLEKGQVTTHYIPNRRSGMRMVFSKEAIAKMEKVFDVTHYPDIDQREKLANQVGEPEARVRGWFQNRRARLQKLRRGLHPVCSTQQKLNNGKQETQKHKKPLCCNLKSDELDGDNSEEPLDLSVKTQQHD